MPDENADYNKGANGQPVTLEVQAEQEERRFSPSVERNRDYVRDAFSKHMPRTGRILEIGSGTGEHGVHMTQLLPDLVWTFTDMDEGSLASATAWMAERGRTDRDRAVVLDASRRDWTGIVGADQFDGLFSANVIHIAPFAVATGLFAGADKVLSQAGRIFLYGPFARDGVFSEGNAAFDADLKRRDARWGVRDLEREIVPLAKANGFALAHCVDMPKNNLSVVFERC